MKKTNSICPNLRCFVLACGLLVVHCWMGNVQPWLFRNTIVAAIGYPVALAFALFFLGQILLDSIRAGKDEWDMKENRETRVMWALLIGWLSLAFVALVSFCEHSFSSNPHPLFFSAAIASLVLAGVLWFVWRDMRRDAYRRRIDWRDHS